MNQLIYLGVNAIAVAFLTAVGQAAGVINSPPTVIGGFVHLNEGDILHVSPDGIVGTGLTANGRLRLNALAGLGHWLQ